MGLIKCEDCGKMVSERAEVCPDCGGPIGPAEDTSTNGDTPKSESSTPKKKGKIGKIIALVIIIIGAIVGYNSYNKYFKDGADNPIPNSVKRMVNAPRIICDKTSTIKEDQYLHYKIKLTETTKVNIVFNVKSGPVIDVITMAASEFPKIQKVEFKDLFKGKQIKYYQDLSTSGKQGNLTARLGAGEYEIVFDNSDIWDTQPPANFKDDTVEVHVKIILQ